MEYKAQNREALKLANALRNNYHSALWEEEKHYTWLVSIILGSIMLVITRAVEYRYVVILALSIIGYVFCRLALNVIKAESKHYQIAFRRCIEIENSVFTKDEEELPPREFIPASDGLLWWQFIRGKSLDIKSAFIFTFVFFKFIFLLVGLASTVTVAWPHVPTWLKC